jgi:hypothetical protein
MHITKYHFISKQFGKLNPETENISPICVEVVKVVTEMPIPPSYKRIQTAHF